MSISAGLILYRKRENTSELEFFVAHPTRSGDIWMFPKGQIEEKDYFMDCNGKKCSEVRAGWVAAYREFYEETGDITPQFLSCTPTYLGKIKQSPKKSVMAFALNCYWELNPNKCFSNEIEVEHPSKSGKMVMIPENDKFAWMTFDELKDKTHPKHIGFYEDLINKKLI